MLQVRCLAHNGTALLSLFFFLYVTVLPLKNRNAVVNQAASVAPCDASPPGPGCTRAFRSEKGLPTRVSVHVLLTFLTSLSLCRQARPGLEVVHVWGLAAAPRDALVAGWQAARDTEPQFEYCDGGIRFAAHRWLPAATLGCRDPALFSAWIQTWVSSQHACMARCSCDSRLCRGIE